MTIRETVMRCVRMIGADPLDDPEPHGTVAVKGRGEGETWFLVGPR